MYIKYTDIAGSFQYINDKCGTVGKKKKNAINISFASVKVS